MRGVIFRLLFFMPFVLPAWILVWWIVRGADLSVLLAVIIALPVSFVVALVMAVQVWLRPDAREARAVTWRDAAWLGAVWLAWLVGGALDGVASVLVMVIATAISAIAIGELGRRLAAVTRQRLDHLAANGAAGRGNAGPGAPPVGPDAGKVITLSPSSAGGDGSGDPDVAGDAADADPHRMPGSTRPPGSPRVDDATPGSHFGANTAGVAENWDATRPVPGDPASDSAPVRGADDDLDGSGADGNDEQHPRQ